MNILLLAVLSTALFAGCCCKPKPPEPDKPDDPSNPTNAVEAIDGSRDYRATPTGKPNTYVVTLPHTTDLRRIKEILLWINTTGLEGIRKDDKITCDEIHLVKDDAAYSLIIRSEMFRSVLNEDRAEVTKGTAVGQGDTFVFNANNENVFEEMRALVSQGRLLVRLVPKVPKSNPVMHSAKVQIVEFSR